MTIIVQSIGHCSRICSNFRKFSIVIMGFSSISINNLKAEFMPIGIKGLASRRNIKSKHIRRNMVPRELKFNSDILWTEVWQSRGCFNYNVVPLPVRQGIVRNLNENDAIIPAKYANLELMKITNFLHLTPEHVYKHCNSLSVLLTNWPNELKRDASYRENYPVTISKRRYFMSASSSMDQRANHVEMTFNINTLMLQEASKHNFEHFCFGPGPGQIYTSHIHKSSEIVLFTKRCPSSKLNLEFLEYVLIVLTLESIKHESFKTSISSCQNYMVLNRTDANNFANSNVLKKTTTCIQNFNSLSGGHISYYDYSLLAKYKSHNSSFDAKTAAGLLQISNYRIGALNKYYR